ncbi:MAG: type II secretion system minor pseudopilin GspI [Thiotrichaceae bacterium]|nr:type II secretion system minor pseudopilin GspI [Thiotrichaceae bacterium]
MQYKNNQGFTLLEVLVALMIIAVSLGAVVATVGAVSRTEARLQTQTFARWVAMNQLAKLEIEHAWPAVGSSTGKEKMAKQEWSWSQKTVSTTDKNLRRVEVSVWLKGQEKKGVITVTGFVRH